MQIDQIDTASASITQAAGVLAMLTTAGTGDDFGQLTHKTVMDTLWAVAALVDNAGAAVDAIHAPKA